MIVAWHDCCLVCHFHIFPTKIFTCHHLVFCMSFSIAFTSTSSVVGLAALPAIKDFICTMVNSFALHMSNALCSVKSGSLSSLPSFTRFLHAHHVPHAEYIESCWLPRSSHSSWVTLLWSLPTAMLCCPLPIPFMGQRAKRIIHMLTRKSSPVTVILSSFVPLSSS